MKASSVFLEAPPSLEPSDCLVSYTVVGLRRWNRDWPAISCDLAQYQRTWAEMVRDAVPAQEETGSTRPG